MSARLLVAGALVLALLTACETGVYGESGRSDCATPAPEVEGVVDASECG